MAEQLIETRKWAPQHLGRVAVLGLGKSGRAVASYLAPLVGTRVEELVVYGGPSSPAVGELASSLERRGIRVLFDTEEVEGPYDCCIASPGISEFSPFCQSAQRASAEVISEVEFAWRESDRTSRWVAITGTNGKTTTTALTAHLLQTAGLAASAVGNIGDVCINAVRNGTTDVYVVETSSFQLASTKRFAPNVAVILTLTPDHITWHKSFENYADAKFKILANLGSVPGSVAILNATDGEICARLRAMRAAATPPAFPIIALGTSEGLAGDMRRACGAKDAAFVRDETFMLAHGSEETALAPLSALRLKGEHNQMNALAAAVAAFQLGATPERIAAGLQTFAPLEHRIEEAGSFGGISFYNDSKATNVDSTLVALSAFLPTRPIVLLGGRDKFTDLAPLVETALRTVKGVVCYGEAGERFYEAFAPISDEIIVLRGEHMADSFDIALSIAESGDVVLLSPACASFDEFSCFEERGDAFKRLVAEHAQRSRP